MVLRTKEDGKLRKNPNILIIPNILMSAWELHRDMICYKTKKKKTKRLLPALFRVYICRAST